MLVRVYQNIDTFTYLMYLCTNRYVADISKFMFSHTSIRAAKCDI